VADTSSWSDYKSPDDLVAEKAKDDVSPTWTDYAKTLGAGAADVGASIGALGQASRSRSP
jgi:hypothetical protein